MKMINVSEATEMQLDWLVAKCEGWAPGVYMREAHTHKDVHGKPVGTQVPSDRRYSFWFRPTIDWSQMGPIIEREHISLTSPSQACCWPWTAIKGPVREFSGGPNRSPLIAAARCYIVSKLGETVEVPEELT